MHSRSKGLSPNGNTIKPSMKPCCLDTAITLLHDYLKQCDRPIHLLGHGVSGLIGLLYARQYPQRVKSLTLLSVGAYPAVNWQAHYYVLRQLISCSREIILSQMVRLLFGDQSRTMTQRLLYLLEQDLDNGFSIHSLAHRTCLPPGGVDVPLLICSSATDLIIAPHSHDQWVHSFKPTDRFWECPEGSHFFHYFYPQQVSRAILEFWFELSQETNGSQGSESLVLDFEFRIQKSPILLRKTLPHPHPTPNSLHPSFLI